MTTSATPYSALPRPAPSPRVSRCSGRMVAVVAAVLASAFVVGITSVLFGTTAPAMTDPRLVDEAWRFTAPDARFLRWTSSGPLAVGSNITEWRGVLSVPLSHRSQETSPKIALEVVLLVAPGQSSASRGVLLGHNGGPGSGARNGALSAYERAALAGENVYYAMGISQRGVQLDTFTPPDAADLARTPRTMCTPDTLKPWPQPSAARWGSYRVDEFTSCECALPNGSPSMGETWVDVDPANDSAVRNYLAGLQQRNRRCYASAKWRMEGSDGTQYNVLDFLGSNVLPEVLAFDLELLRRGLRVPKMSVLGYSYGTAVGSTFATIFPDSIDRLELNSNVPPDPDTESLATGAARGLEQGWDKLLQMCADLTRRGRQGEARYHPLGGASCPLGDDPWGAAERLIGALRGVPGLTAKATADSPPFRLGIGMVGGYVSTCFNLKSWDECLGHLGALASADEAVRDAKIKEILDDRCRLPDPRAPKNASRFVRTWRVYGVCIGASHIGMNFDQQDSFVDQSSIMGVDYYGRFSLHAAMRAYRRAHNAFGVPATGAFLGWFGAFFDWPVAPDPIRSGGSTAARALIAGNLYDTSTPFGWTVKMRAAFTNSALIVSQGDGHITDGRKRWINFQFCGAAIAKYWRSGELPPDGLVCREDAPVRPPARRASKAV